MSSLLLAALKRDNPDLAEYPEDFMAEMATVLAECLEHNPRTIRSMAFNLPRNPQLRSSLLAGTLEPKALCSMDLAELAVDSVKRQRAAAADRVDATIRSRAAANHLCTFTRSVRCPECGAREARFVHEGVDQRDWHGRKNEVWGTKHDDDESAGMCTITCVACNSTWQSGEAPTECDEPEPIQAPAHRPNILGWKNNSDR